MFGRELNNSILFSDIHYTVLQYIGCLGKTFEAD